MRRYLFRISKFFGLVVALAVMLSLSFVLVKIYKVRADQWLSWDHVLINDRVDPSIKHVFLVLVDHWEPGNRLSKGIQSLQSYREVARRHRDANGRPLQVTWAYPFDLRHEVILKELARAAFEGFGEVEAHWHHYHEDPAEFEGELAHGVADFNKYGALIHEGDNVPRFVFVHGNWALDGSIPERCGISNELEIISRYGAYADATFPAIGTAAHPSRVHGLFRVTDSTSPKSYDAGTPVRAGIEGDGLLMLEGPLGLDLKNPLIMYESGALDDQELTGFSGMVNRLLGRTSPWRPHRAVNWLQLAPRVEGKEDWAFVKLHTHGIEHDHFIFELLDAAIGAFLRAATTRGIQVHFVSAREAYNLIRAVETGDADSDDPTAFYDYEIGRPMNKVHRYFD